MRDGMERRPGPFVSDIGGIKIGVGRGPETRGVAQVGEPLRVAGPAPLSER